VMVIPNPRAELNPVLTVGRQISNVVLHHMGVGRREADRVALAMLRAVRIPDPERRFDAYPHELSGGMAQRVVIAIALVCSPRLVISDDATSGLDVTVQAQVLDLLQTMVREKGAAALFITRDLAIPRISVRGSPSSMPARSSNLPRHASFSDVRGTPTASCCSLRSRTIRRCGHVGRAHRNCKTMPP
jgi:ABC-type dipeptide/oligopeptide/nickel transport system ATPase subunit